MWMMSLHLQVINQKFDYDDDEPCYAEYVCHNMCITVLPNFYPMNLIEVCCKHVFSIRVGIG